MKVSEYTPLYGLLFNFEYLTGIDGKKMTVNEMFENYPDFELTDIHINQLDTFDLFSLQTVLKDVCITEKIIIPYLRDMFDEYRQAGGNPFVWLHRTFESINLNPHNYKAEYRGILEKTLIEWIENFEKQPYDLKYNNENRQILLSGYNYEPFLDINNEYYIRLEEHKESFQSRFSFIDENDIQTEFELNDFLENEHYDLNIIFEQEYNIFSENSIYFYGCSFEIYLKTYPERLKSYLKEFPDANEIDFCTYELNSNFTYIASKSINDKIGYSIKKRIEFLNNKVEPKATIKQLEPLDLSDTSAVEKIIVIKEPYGEIFANNGFELFEYILSEYVKPKNTIGRFEDLSYYYRCLFEDKFIHQKPEPFRLWFIEKYTDEFTKIKTKIQATSPQRKKDYSSALDWFKLQNK